MNRKAVRKKRRDKAKGYVVKGITKRHWWDRYDKDPNNSRAQLARDTRREVESALAERRTQ